MNEIQTIVIGLVALAALLVFYYAQRKQIEALIALIGPFAAVLEGLIQGADVALAAHGDALRPVNDLVRALGSMVDQDDDYLTKHLPPDVVALLRQLIGRVDRLTDGEAPVETAADG